jgi:F-type H+-transporting ATPase subunit b
MDLLAQLKDLVIGSVPTMILFILLVAAYGFLVRRPLDRVLAERRARTTGAVEQARGAIAAAEAETAAYEEKLRAARSAILAAREQKLKTWNEQRAAALAEARTAAGQRVLAAHLEIEQSAGAARRQIESATEMLSVQILKAVLPAGVASTEAAQ